MEPSNSTIREGLLARNAVYCVFISSCQRKLKLANSRKKLSVAAWLQDMAPES